MSTKLEDIPAWVKSVIALVGVAFAVFLFMEERHASRVQVAQFEYSSSIEIERLRADTLLKDLRAQLRDISNVLDINAKALAFYRKMARKKTLEDSEIDRFEYLEKTVPIQQTQALELQKEVRAQEMAVERINDGK